MAKTLAGFTAGVLAGAAGATALNAATYADQAVRGDAATSSPAGSAPARAARKLTGADRQRAAAAGPLGGLGIGVGVGAVAGMLRGASTTPPFAVASAIVGLAAMAVGDGIAVATGTARPDWASPANLARDLLPHLSYGATTVWALHRMLDPHTPDVSR